jgi:hypothetical protein
MTLDLNSILDSLTDIIADKVVERLAKTGGPGANENEDEDELLTTEQAAKIVNIPKKTLEGYRARGTGPKFVRHGRLIRYRRSDLLKSSRR